MSYDTEHMEKVFDRVEELAEAYREARKSETKGTPFGSENMAPQDVIAFVEQKALEQPGYIEALPHVKGGEELLAAYERAAGLR